MSKELVIASNHHETKVAILEEDQLAEIYFQRGDEYSLAGSIHKGRVTRVLPGMQSAFVDLGLERDTFLYVSDFFEENEDIDTVTEEKPDRNDRRDRGPGRTTERPAAVPRTVSEAIVVPISTPDFAVETPKVAVSEERVQGSASEVRPLAAEQKQSEPVQGKRPDGDRAGRDQGIRGDRKGRRSRRRRTGGGGFPENKYAQPGAPEIAARHTDLPETKLRESGPAPVRSLEGEDRDVIMLPGESLAKYRHITTASESEPSAFEEPDVETTEEDTTWESNRESELALHEELEAEAQELELTDKIFSHRDDESVPEVEDKFEEVRQDQASSPFVVNDIDTEETSAVQEREDLLPSASAEFRSSPTIERLYVPAVYVPEQQKTVEAERTLKVREPVDKFLIGTPDDEFPDEIEETAGLSAAEHLADEVEESQAFELEELERRDIENEPAGEDTAVEAGSAEPRPDGAVVLAHPAGPPDQSGRVMHRGSRRMRRRRGSNRFSQPNGDAAPAALTPPAFAPVAAALVIQPEMAAEMRRETTVEESPERLGRVMPSIAELLKAGQEIIVQIAKEPLGQKGARITSHIALPGRYVVFMPSVTHLGVSRKIASDEERQRLKRILQAHRAGTTGGFIVRTAGEGIPEEEIAADMDFLYKLWLDIRQKAEKKPAPALLHYDLDIVQRILRDQVTADFKAIWVDSEEMYENVLSFTQRFQPALVNRVKMYTRSAPIFDAFGVTQELEKALRPKVWLKSGGYIVINQTEALVAIDINTGKYVGKSNRLEDTIVKTNVEAVKEIVRQIRLRDLGGIIVLDFIDMDERKNRQKVMQTLEEAMQADRAPCKILQFNDFGLVAITRKRVKQSLERTLCAPCPYCEGAGYVKSVQTIIGEILVEAQKIAKAIEGKDVMLRVHPEVAKILKGNDNKYLEELEQFLGRPVLVKGDPSLHQEKFDLG